MQLKYKQLDCQFNCTDLYTIINQCLIESSCAVRFLLVVVGCYIFYSQNLTNEANFDDVYEIVGTCLIYISSPLHQNIPSHHFPSVCQCLEEVHYTLLYCQAFLSQVKLSVFNFHNHLPLAIICTCTCSCIYYHLEMWFERCNLCCAGHVWQQT